MYTLDAHDDDAIESMFHTLDNSLVPTLANADVTNFLATVILLTDQGKNHNQALYQTAKRIFTGADAATVARQINLAARCDRKHGHYAYWEEK